jgi:hypothetical protein
MSADPTADGLAAAAEATTRALANIAVATNPAVAATAAEMVVRISTSFMLSNLGPEAAKRMLASVWNSLDEEIRAANGGMNALQ